MSISIKNISMNQFLVVHFWADFAAECKNITEVLTELKKVSIDAIKTIGTFIQFWEKLSPS